MSEKVTKKAEEVAAESNESVETAENTEFASTLTKEERAAIEADAVRRSSRKAGSGGSSVGSWWFDARSVHASVGDWRGVGKARAGFACHGSR